MREIKFRAWNKNHSKMYSVYCIDWKHGLVFCKSIEGTTHTFGLNDVVLLQFTGLHDNTKWKELSEEERSEWTRSGHMPSEWKGREIYEGDIDGSDEPMYVTFEDGSFGLNDFKYFDPFINWNQLEIIGNVYENPELIG